MTSARDIMVSSRALVSEWETLRSVAKVMVDNDVSAVPVRRAGGTFIGVISRLDIIQCLARDDDPALVKAGELVPGEPVDVDIDTYSDDILAVMDKYHLSWVPVTVGRALVGVVSRTQLSRPRRT